MTPAIVVKRTVTPEGDPEVPFWTARGFKMADPSIGAERHHVEHAKFEQTIEGVVARLRQGWSLWMKQPGKRETLIQAASLDFPRS